MNTKEIEKQIIQIRELEDRVIALKRQLLRSSSLLSISQLDQDRLAFVLLRFDHGHLAIPLHFVLEVIQMVELIPASETVPGVLGLLNYHGKVLAVIDIGELIGRKKSVITSEKSMAICRLEPFDFALIADDVSEIVAVGPEDVEVAEEILPGSLNAIGVVKTKDQTALIIDLWSIVTSIQAKFSQDDDSAIL
ncbi:MAG: chemotaxis protein CheW [Deltaproteobacteria bacterium]|nr:chemotaxis protein CheW [Deltaproteobacteria bacterium]